MAKKGNIIFIPDVKITGYNIITKLGVVPKRMYVDYHAFNGDEKRHDYTRLPLASTKVKAYYYFGGDYYDKQRIEMIEKNRRDTEETRLIAECVQRHYH